MSTSRGIYVGLSRFPSSRNWRGVHVAVHSPQARWAQAAQVSSSKPQHTEKASSFQVLPGLARSPSLPFGDKYHLRCAPRTAYSTLWQAPWRNKSQDFETSALTRTSRTCMEKTLETLTSNLMLLDAPKATNAINTWIITLGISGHYSASIKVMWVVLLHLAASFAKTFLASPCFGLTCWLLRLLRLLRRWYLSGREWHLVKPPEWVETHISKFLLLTDHAACQSI